MKRFALLTVAAAGLLLVSACGGGGGSARPADDPEPPPMMEDESIGFADTLIIGEPVSFLARREARGRASCSGPECTVKLWGQTVPFDVRRLDPSRMSEWTVGDYHTRNGVLLRDVRLRDITMWGAWGSYSLAAIGRGTLWVDLPETVFMDVRLSRFVVPLSVGMASGTNPVSGSATWSGVAVGSELTAHNIANRLTFDASLQVDFTTATLDLSFLPHSGLCGDPCLREITWRDVPIDGGTFTDDGLDGRFYGPNHEEAGGIFEDGQIAGAFVTLRQ